MRQAADVRILVGEVSIPMGVEDPRYTFDAWIQASLREQWDWLTALEKMGDVTVEHVRDIAEYSMIYRVFVELDEDTALLYRLTFGNRIS